MCRGSLFTTQRKIAKVGPVVRALLNTSISRNTSTCNITGRHYRETSYITQEQEESSRKRGREPHAWKVLLASPVLPSSRPASHRRPALLLMHSASLLLWLCLGTTLESTQINWKNKFMFISSFISGPQNWANPVVNYTPASWQVQMLMLSLWGDYSNAYYLPSHTASPTGPVFALSYHLFQNPSCLL